MNYDLEDPGSIAKALIAGEKPIYASQEGKLYRLTLSGTRKNAVLSEIKGVIACAEEENSVLGRYGYSITTVSKLIRTANVPEGNQPPNIGPKKPRIGDRQNEFAGFLISRYPIEHLRSGNIALDDVWHEMAKKRPGLLDRYGDTKEMKSDFNAVRRFMGKEIK